MPRERTIASVKTPLAFFALALLVTEGILAMLAARAQGQDFTLLVAGMLFVMLALMGFVLVFFRLARPEEHAVDEFTDVFVGMVDEYRKQVDSVFSEPLDIQKDEVLLGRCRGMVMAVHGFRRFVRTLEALLNSQLDELGEFLAEIREKDRLQLNSDERKRLKSLLVAIKHTLEGKIREAELEEAQLRALLKQQRKKRTARQRTNLT